VFDVSLKLLITNVDIIMIMKVCRKAL
jgi:hypothetical protein